MAVDKAKLAAALDWANGKPGCGTQSECVPVLVEYILELQTHLFDEKQKGVEVGLALDKARVDLQAKAAADSAEKK